MRTQSAWITLALLLVGRVAFAESATEYLERVSATYRQVTSFQVESVAESTTAIADRTVPLVVRVALYFRPPDTARIEVKGRNNALQTVMISDGDGVTEFHQWDGSLTRTPGASINVEFTPERGMGMGEMLYSMITSGVQLGNVPGT